MAGILSAIWCYLQDLIPAINTYFVRAYDALLGVADSMLMSFPAMALGSIDPAYTWLLGATGMSQALAIIAGAMLTRFLLQTIPFVRWGS